MRMSNFSYLVKRGVGSVFRNAMMSIASFSVLLVSLLLMGLGVLVAMDLNIVLSNIEEKNEIDVYVYGDVSDDVKQKAHSKLAQWFDEDEQVSAENIFEDNPTDAPV